VQQLLDRIWAASGPLVLIDDEYAMLKAYLKTHRRKRSFAAEYRAKHGDLAEQARLAEDDARWGKLRLTLEYNRLRREAPQAPASGVQTGERSGPPTKDDGIPSPEELRAYIAWKGGTRQRTIGEHLQVSQATVHRMKERVAAWLVKGNKLPGLDELPGPNQQPRIYSVAPKKMERFTEDDDE
jgi:hypothetical protein